jgi:hypothetical protein
MNESLQFGPLQFGAASADIVSAVRQDESHARFRQRRVEDAKEGVAAPRGRSG